MRRLFQTHKQLATGIAAVLGIAAVGCRDKDNDAGEGALVPPVGVPVLGADPASDTAGVMPPESGVPGSIDRLLGTGGGTPAAVEVPLDIPTTLYEIQKGDTLSGIAGAHGTSVATLQKLNGITGSFIRYGQKIKVPADATAAPSAPDPVPGAGAELSTQPPAVAVPPVSPRLPSGEEPLPTPPPSRVGGAETGFGFGADSAPRPAGDGFLTVPPAN